MSSKPTIGKLAIATGAIAMSVMLSGCSVLDSFMPGSSPVRDEDTGQITESQDRADIFQMRVGDCLNTSSSGDVVAAVPVVPCDQEHEDEIYFGFDLPDGSFPGSDEIDAAAESTCLPEFSKYVGIDYSESLLDWYPFTPTAESWDQGDREILCVVYDNSTLTTGSLAGAAR